MFVLAVCLFLFRQKLSEGNNTWFILKPLSHLINPIVMFCANKWSCCFKLTAELLKIRVRKFFWALVEWFGDPFLSPHVLFLFDNLAYYISWLGISVFTFLNYYPFRIPTVKGKAINRHKWLFEIIIECKMPLNLLQIKYLINVWILKEL